MISIIQHIFKNNFFENKNIKIDLTEIQKKFSLKNKRNFFPWGIFFADIFLKIKVLISLLQILLILMLKK